MNLIEFDNVKPKVDKTGTWVNIKNKQLFSRQIKRRKYATIVKRFNKTTNDNDYFVVFTDTYPQYNTLVECWIDDYGRTKVTLKSIWNESNLQYYKEDVNITLELYRQEDDGEIYKLIL